MMTVLHKNGYTAWALTLNFGGDGSKTTAIGKTKDIQSANGRLQSPNGANVEVVNAEAGVQNVADVVRLTDFIRSDFDTTKRTWCITLVGDSERAGWHMTVLIDHNHHLERTLLLVLLKRICIDANRHSFGTTLTTWLRCTS